MAGPRIEREKKSIETMIHLYCKGNHGGGDTLCKECGELLEYARHRLEHCPFGEEKTKCSACTVHCYRPDMRQRVIAVMRYCGPRMVYKDPLEALRHMLGK